MVYAEINAETGKCFAVSDFGNLEVDSPTLIPIDRDSTNVLNKIWTGAEWIDDPSPEQQFKLGMSEMEAAVYETQASAEYNTCLLELLSM